MAKQESASMHELLRERAVLRMLYDKHENVVHMGPWALYSEFAHRHAPLSRGLFPNYHQPAPQDLSRKALTHSLSLSLNRKAPTGGPASDAVSQVFRRLSREGLEQFVRLHQPDQDIDILMREYWRQAYHELEPMTKSERISKIYDDLRYCGDHAMARHLTLTREEDFTALYISNYMAWLRTKAYPVCKPPRKIQRILGSGCPEEQSRHEKRTQLRKRLERRKERERLTAIVQADRERRAMATNTKTMN